MGNGQSAAYHKLLTHMRNNHVAKFKKVLKECAHYRNFDLNHPVEKDKSLLAIACAENREEMVLAILDSKVLRIKDNITSTLFFAVENGQPNILKILLSRNETDPNAMKNKQTALHVAVQKGSYTSCLLLLKFGADPNIQNGKGQTALHLAAQVQRQDLAELILRQSNIINVKLDDVQDNRDRSPRDVLINRFPKIDLLPQIESEEILALSKYLQLGQEEKFCEAFQEVKTIDTDDLKKLIKMAVHNGQQMALAELLKREKSLFIDMTKVFDDALDRGDHQVLKMLLDRKVLLRNDYDVLLRAAQLLGVPCEMEDRFPGARFECLKLIAEHQNVSIRHEYYQTASELVNAVVNFFPKLLLHMGMFWSL